MAPRAAGWGHGKVTGIVTIVLVDTEVHPLSRSLMKRILAQFSLLVLGILLSSCLEMTSVITASKDGSAIIEETVLVSAQMKAMMAAAGASGGEQGGPSMKDLLPDKAKAEERAKKLGEGVTVKSHEQVKSPDGREGVKVTYAVPNVANLKYQPFNSDNKGSDTEKPMTFKVEGGKLTVSMPPGKQDSAPAERPKVPKEQMEAQLAMMKPMFAGMRVAVQIKGANGIASSDATNLKDDTVTIMDIQFDKIMEKPDTFSKIMESADDKSMTPAKAAQMFKDVDGLKIEGKENISITLK